MQPTDPPSDSRRAVGRSPVTAPIESPDEPAGPARHSAAGAPGRWLWLLIPAAAILAVVLGLIGAYALATGGGRPTADAAGTTPVGTNNLEPSDGAVPEPTDSTPSPDGSASWARSQTPAELVAALRSTVTMLSRERQISTDGAEELTKRLQEVQQAMAAGDLSKTWGKLREFADKVANLNKEGKLSASGYQRLATLTTQLAQLLPSR